MMRQLEWYLLREKTIQRIREFFLNQDFHEVITPILNESIPLEPNIYPFETIWDTTQGKKIFYLATSPEKNLKKMLAIGIENCFSIGHSFRNLEASGSLHTPEFLMLEWYRKNADYKKIMQDVKDLMKVLGINDTWQTFSLPGLFKKNTKVDLIELTNDETKRADYDKIFVNEIESRLPKEPCFITDFPSIISPLCKPKKDNPMLAERFELYWKGIELGNGNTENTDIESIKKNLRKPLDQEFLNSLKEMQDSSYAGVGVGIDRLTMILLNMQNISNTGI